MNKSKTGKKNAIPDTPFMSVKDACRVTGLSQWYLRNGCKDGSVPHVRSGRCLYINVPALLQVLGVPQTPAAGNTHT